MTNDPQNRPKDEEAKKVAAPPPAPTPAHNAISRAPPPGVPVRSVSSGKGANRSAGEPIDWKYWTLRPTVKHWQAAALSLGISPYAIHKHPEFWEQHNGRPAFEQRWFSSDKQLREFRERCDLVEACIRQIEDKALRIEYLLTNNTSLSLFARWAFAHDLSLPPEMTTFAENAPRGDSTPVPVVRKKEGLSSEERINAIRREHEQLVAKGHKSPTKALAEKYGVSETRIRDLKSKSIQTPSANPWSELVKPRR